jgi:hypothetical protein
MKLGFLDVSRFFCLTVAANPVAKPKNLPKT